MAPRIAASRCLTSILRMPKPTLISTALLRPHPRLPRTRQPVGRRFAHAIPKPPGPARNDANTDTNTNTNTNGTRTRKQTEPFYILRFTCVPCNQRSEHDVSKQGYHYGSVLITCPNCRNRHVISDNLNIFGDRKINVEDLLREKGQLVKRGYIGEDGDIEFWPDNLAETAPSPSPSSPSSSSSSSLSSGEGGEDEARRLRETRDPSSGATDPTPSASGLPSDAGTRPSIHGASRHGPAPSTRRQYHTKRRKPAASRQTTEQPTLHETERSSSHREHENYIPPESIASPWAAWSEEAEAEAEAEADADADAEADDNSGPSQTTFPAPASPGAEIISSPESWEMGEEPLPVDAHPTAVADTAADPTSPEYFQNVIYEAYKAEFAALPKWCQQVLLEDDGDPDELLSPGPGWDLLETDARNITVFNAGDDHFTADPFPSHEPPPGGFIGVRRVIANETEGLSVETPIVLPILDADTPFTKLRLVKSGPGNRGFVFQVFPGILGRRPPGGMMPVRAPPARVLRKLFAHAQ